MASVLVGQLEAFQSSTPGAPSDLFEIGSFFNRAAPGCLPSEQIFIDVPGFPQKEIILLFTPEASVSPQTPGRLFPLLVFNHRFGVSHFDLITTRFAEEACRKDWFALSVAARQPFGNQPENNYGSAPSQEFARAGLEFVLENNPIDLTRIYGVGFSMGGAQSMSYAARHQDPDRGMFAAVVNHTGSVDQSDTWLSSTLARSPLELALQGTPSLVPFAYRQSSVIEIDPVTGSLVNMDMAFVQNLILTPTQIWVATQDPWPYLADQTILFNDFLTQQPGANVELNTVATVEHNWDTIDYRACVDFLDQHSLVIPNERRVIADRDGRWLYFDVSGIPTDTFAAFEYQSDLDNNHFTISEGQSFGRIETDLARWNNDQVHPLPLFVNLSFEAGGTEVVLSSLDGTPVSVTRDGVPQATGWTYDPITQTLMITEPDPGRHSWEFQP